MKLAMASDVYAMLKFEDCGASAHGCKKEGENLHVQPNLL